MKREFVSRQQYARWRRFLSYCFPAASRSATLRCPDQRFWRPSARGNASPARARCLYQTGVVSTGGSISTITRPLFQRLSFILFDVFRDTHRNNRHPSGNSRVKSPGFKRQQAAAAAAVPSGNIQNEILRFLKALTTSAIVPCALVRLLRSISRLPVSQYSWPKNGIHSRLFFYLR